jgi:hypothetical protein
MPRPIIPSDKRAPNKRIVGPRPALVVERLLEAWLNR